MGKATNYSEFFSVYLNQHVEKGTMGEAKLDCPLCGKEEHFFGNCDNGLWHCKSCDEAGNNRKLITLIHEKYLLQTTDNQLAFIANIRYISVDILREAGFAYDSNVDRWYVPYWYYDPTTGAYSEYLTNLGYFCPSLPNEKERFTIKKGKGFNTYLYNPGITFPDTRKVIICEGEWDTLAYYDSHRHSDDLILGKPGSGFPIQVMQGMVGFEEFHLLTDNDIEGQKQKIRAVGVIRNEMPKARVFELDWSLVENAPKDIRDLWKDKSRKDNIIADISNAMVENEDIADSIAMMDPDRIAPGHVLDVYSCPVVPSFTEYINRLRSSMMYLTPVNIQAIVAVHAITCTIGIRDQPLWAFLIAPPSSGKTTIIDSFGGNNQWFDCLSKLSSESLVSGWNDDNEEEASYLPRLDNKTLFVKDFTVTLQETVEKQKKVMGLLTDIYDGYIKIHFGNRKLSEFTTYFNMIAGVTPIVYSHSSVSIGERFIKIDWLGKDYDRREYTKRAVRNFGGDSEVKKKELTEATLGFSQHLRNKELDPRIDDMYLDPITDLAEFVAILRTQAISDRFEGLMFRPEAELAPRLGKQFCKMYVGSKHVLENTEDAYKIVRKIAFDTSHGFPLDIVNHIKDNPRSTREDIVRGIDIHSQRVYRVLKDLVVTKVLKEKSMASSKPGRPTHYFEINPALIPALEPDKYLDHDTYTNPKSPSYKGRQQQPHNVRRLPPGRS
jgi:ribosomal protein L37AE/L43A